jgi:thioredoxin reductase
MSMSPCVLHPERVERAGCRRGWKNPGIDFYPRRTRTVEGTDPSGTEVAVSDGVRDSYDVVVIGGGPAGLNGALMLARSRRAVLVIDGGEPRNSVAHGVHGLLGHDGTPPRDLLDRGRTEVEAYGGQFMAARVVGAAREDGSFSVRTDDGTVVEARRLLVTTGVRDELPGVDGVSELWGRDVLHCPYCHGWEVRDKAIGVLASGPRSMHQALLFRQLSEDLIYFTNGMPLPSDDAEKLAARAVRVVDGDVARLETDGGRLSGVRMRDGALIRREALVVASRLVADAGFFADLGLMPKEHPSGLGEHIEVDPTGRTEISGVWAAGNVTDPGAQVGSSAAAGATAGAQINADLVDEETRRAIEAFGH